MQILSAENWAQVYWVLVTWARDIWAPPASEHKNFERSTQDIWKKRLSLEEKNLCLRRKKFSLLLVLMNEENSMFAFSCHHTLMLWKKYALKLLRSWNWKKCFEIKTVFISFADLICSIVSRIRKKNHQWKKNQIWEKIDFRKKFDFQKNLF